MRCLEFAQGKTLSRGFFDEYSFKQLFREMRGQWQKCYSEASMSIYYYDVWQCVLITEFFLSDELLDSQYDLQPRIYLQ